MTHECKWCDAPTGPIVGGSCAGCRGVDPDFGAVMPWAEDVWCCKNCGLQFSTDGPEVCPACGATNDPETGTNRLLLGAPVVCGFCGLPIAGVTADQFGSTLDADGSFHQCGNASTWAVR